VGFGGGFGGMGGGFGGMDSFGGMGSFGGLAGFHMAEPHTYHLDIRFENGFTQMSVLADAIAEALRKGKRVVVEHFDLVYPLLNINANLLIGVGEEVIVSRPNIFGPEPEEIRQKAYASLPYRLMAHTAEDLCEFCLGEELTALCGHDDVRHGFCMYFQDSCPDVDLAELERKVNEMIAQNLPIGYVDEHHVSIGGNIHYCTGPRIHMAHTGQVQNFRLMNHFIYDPFKRRYLMIGCVGENSDKLLEKLDLVRQHPLAE
jgi:hypothetical protein